MVRKLKHILLCIFLGVTFFCGVYAEGDASLTDQLISDYAIVIDADTGQVLSEKKADEKIYPASMTKMMTALIAMENISDYSERITVTKEALEGLAAANASVAGFKEGDTPTALELLYGIALPSGADASNTLALHIAGSQEAFAQLMNDKAKELGMDGTHFVNMTGLDEADHYTTCRDLAKLLKYCLQNDTFRTIFSTDEFTTGPLSDGSTLTMYSTAFSAIDSTKAKVPGFQGAKTGYTGRAEHCMAYWASLNDMDLIIVTAHAAGSITTPSHIYDASKLLQDIEDSWHRQTAVEADEVYRSVEFIYPFGSQSYDLRAAETVTMDLDDSCEVQIDLPESLYGPLTDSGILEGNVKIVQNEAVMYEKEISVPVCEDLWLEEYLNGLISPFE